jgi:Rrf2 family protein
VILTQQEEFGLRCALTIARATLSNEGGAPATVTLNQIAEAEGLTTPYAGKIMRLLVQAGLVESTRGRTGGYRLTRSVRETRISDVLHALGNKFYDGEICQRTTSGEGLCVHNNDCAVRSLWSGLQQMIDQYLSRTTLYDLIADEATMDQTMSVLHDSIELQSTVARPAGGV